DTVGTGACPSVVGGPDHSGIQKEKPMKRSLQAIMAAAALVAAGHAAAQITLYEHEGFRGRAITANGAMPNLDRTGMNDQVSSIVVERGRWIVCEHARFEGRCVVLRHGNYPSMREFNLNNQIS